MTEWISVKDKEPEIGRAVLLYSEFGIVECGERTLRKYKPYITTWTHDELIGVTHWMPLPEPPKDGET